MNWNGSHLLKKYLSSVVDAAAVVRAEVVVIDNGSKDDSVAFCQTHFPSVRVEEMGLNKGYLGRNVIARQSDKDVIVTLDNDVLVEKDFLSPLLALFADGNDVFAVTPSICTYPPGETSALQAEATNVDWHFGMLRRGQTCPRTQVAPIFYNCACATAWDRKKLIELNGFDEIFFPIYHDETDLSWRGWKRGWKCLYEPSSTVYHAVGTSVGRSEKVTTLMLRNEFIFHWKNLTTPSFIVTHIAATLPRLLIAAVRGDKARISGFFQATGKMKNILQSRRNVLPQFIIGDKEVVNRINRFQS